MKKWMAVLVAMLLVVSLTACGDSKKQKSKNDDDDDNGSPDSTVSQTDVELAEECYEDVLNAKSAGELDGLVTDNYDGYYAKVRDAFPESSYAASLEKVCDYEEYEVYSCEIKDCVKDEVLVTGYEVFKRNGDRYLLVSEDAVLQAVSTKFRCGVCAGSGSQMTQGNTCAICGGTGVQYQANAYYDAALQMWMGQTTACPGCAGSGKVGAVTSVCSNCGGRGLVFH